MDEAQAHVLGELTQSFYAQVGESFAATRQAPWPGWDYLLDLVAPHLGAAPRILDLACGNLRFERLLAKRLCEARVCAVDSADLAVPGEGLALAKQGVCVDWHKRDLAQALMQGDDLGRELGYAQFDLAVCLAFAHHLPLEAQRRRLVKALVDCVRPQGCVALSFWQFERDARLRDKARAATAEACSQLGIGSLGPHDWILGWQGVPGVWRYCHHFGEDEIDALVAGVASRASEVGCFSADGRTGDLNRYVVLRVDA